MSGRVRGSSGQAGDAAQSKSDGHSTLNDNAMLDSFGSNPAGGSVEPTFETIENVYSEWSPLPSVRTTRVRAKSSTVATRLASACGGSAFAGAHHSIPTVRMR